jgi:hypothetical protein
VLSYEAKLPFLSVRADCSNVDAPGQIPDHGGLTDFGKVIYYSLSA